jgi:signal transduction histidine kinase
VGRLTGLRAPLAVAAGGALLVVGVTVSSGMGPASALQLAAWAAGTALVSGGLVVVGLRHLRDRSLGTQIVLVATLPTLGSLAGVWLGARAMFFSDHDLVALVVLLLAAGAVGIATALALGHRVARSGDDLIDAARRLADGDAPVTPPAGGPGEMERLARELEAASVSLREARRRERALESSRRELIAWVSHDLRTPLAGVRAIAEALEDGIADDRPTVERYLRTLRTEVDQLAALVDDLFELSRAQHGLLVREFERICLHDLVSDAMAGVSVAAEAKGVRLVGRVEGPPVEVEAAPTDLLRALRNILENAVRHTPSERSVIVEAGRDGDDAYVSILDCGGGIPHDQLARVFDAGFRGDPARTPGGGAGLGLAIAREVVAAHRGRIAVRNENGGAQFVVRVPARLAPDP